MMIAALAIAALAAGSSVGPQSSMNRPSDVELPVGRLQLVSGNDTGGFFIDLERSTVSDGRADLWVLHMAPEPYGTAEAPNRRDWVLMFVDHAVIDCSARTYELLGNQAFSEDGRMVAWLPSASPRPIRDGEGPDFFVRVLCDGESPPSPAINGGHQEARQVIRRIFAAHR